MNLSTVILPRLLLDPYVIREEIKIQMKSSTKNSSTNEIFHKMNSLSPKNSCVQMADVVHNLETGAYCANAGHRCAPHGRPVHFWNLEFLLDFGFSFFFFFK